MRVLVLGAGLQGQAAVHDLLGSQDVQQVVAADANSAALGRLEARYGSDKLSTVCLDASDSQRLATIMKSVDAAIVLLPPALTVPTAAIAVQSGCHWVDASYSRPEYEGLSEEAAAKGVAILPEFGLDPGIDLVLAAAVLRQLDEVEEFLSYGAGIPEPAAADNPLNYKISWTFAGVLNSYCRPARLIQDGDIQQIEPSTVFAPEHLHLVEIDGVGNLEAYPNGDAVKYVELLGLGSTLKQAGRYSMRWPGHAAAWKLLIDLGFLSDAPISVGSSQVTPRQFVHDLLLPQLQYQDHERDLAIVRVDAVGTSQGRRRQISAQVVDRRDLETGFLAMQRTVGYTASIGAQMIVRGDVKKRGLLAPMTDVPADIVLAELEKRGIHVEYESKWLTS